jgi:hypothetical protein
MGNRYTAVTWKSARRRYLAVSKKKEKAEKPRWKFRWRNLTGFGRLARMALGGVLIFLGTQSEGDEGPKMPLLASGVVLLVLGLIGWDSTRAIFKRPTRKAYLRHYPETEAAAEAAEEAT